MAASCAKLRSGVRFYSSTYNRLCAYSFSSGQEWFHNNRLKYRGCSALAGAASGNGDVQSTFEKMVRERRRRARRSALVHVYSKFVVSQLYNYCQTYGNINRADYYTITNDKDFVLVEFENEESIHNLMKQTSHFDAHNVIPIRSGYLFYRETQDSKDQSGSGRIDSEIPSSEEQLFTQLYEAKSVLEQMSLHHEHVRLTDLGSQLRFFVCHQLESMFQGFFSNCIVLPFGSSVNGFGKRNCDLDMVMSFNEWQKVLLVQMQRYLEVFGDILSNFLPGCSNVHRILHARVPIVKFQQDLVQVDCDLSMNSLSGVYMSELLYLYGEFDERVRPLVFTILKWAKQSGLTHENPGKWITNFTLILMVIVFLQCRPQPVLPSLRLLQEMAGPSDQRFSEEIDCTFLRNLKAFPKMHNNEALDSLLMEFFKFYSSFNFKSYGLSLTEGCYVDKADFSPLYIRNPLESELNVSKNVNNDEVLRMSRLMKSALWNLETSHSITNDSKLWGLLRLFDAQSNNLDLKKRKFPVSVFFESKSDSNDNANAAASESFPRDHKNFVKKLELNKLMEKNKGKKKTKSKTRSRHSTLRRPRPWTF